MNGLRKRTTRFSSRIGIRGGFTLVEMLVSVALVVLMMLMFAQIFQITAGSITTQKGLAENDQRARMLTTVIKGDLARRTMRAVAPIGPSEDSRVGTISGALGVGSDQREGYVYISENDPDNDTDDVLQFTIRTTVDERLTGRAVLLDDGPLNGDEDDLNQPEGDDGRIEFGDFNGDGTNEWEINPNNTGESQVAEVSYFLRAGNLYRRVLLVRQPYSDPGRPNNPRTQPYNVDTDMTVIPQGFDYNRPPNAPPPNAGVGRSFWNDFDYSAYYDATGEQRVEFHDAIFPNGSLDPDYRGNNPSTDFRLVDPRYRFGHWLGQASGVYGRPREFDTNGNFIGRFTQEETSHPDFNYPGMLANNNPFNPNTTITLANDGVVNQYRHDPQIGSRRGDDLLLSNVHSFDVKMWDAGLSPPSFEDVGHTKPGGLLNATSNQHKNMGLVYGPHDNPALNNVFDTWATNLDIDQDGVADPPPYPSVLGPAPNSPGGPSPVPGAPGDDDDGGTGPADFSDITDELFYPSTDDVRPIRAIQITIRYLDTDSGQLRQLTIEHSLVD